MNFIDTRGEGRSTKVEVAVTSSEFTTAVAGGNLYREERQGEQKSCWPLAVSRWLNLLRVAGCWLLVAGL